MIDSFCAVFSLFSKLIPCVLSLGNIMIVVPTRRSHTTETRSYLVMEGKQGQPKMMTVGLHCRLSRPARVAALAEFVDYAKSYGKDVWITTRESIANHWYDNHLPRGCGNPILSVGDRRAKKTAKASSKRYSFLGNLTVPRDSEEYRQSLQVKKSDSEEVVDVI